MPDASVQMFSLPCCCFSPPLLLRLQFPAAASHPHCSSASSSLLLPLTPTAPPPPVALLHPACNLWPALASRLQIMHRFHFNSVLKRMSTIVESEGEGARRWASKARSSVMATGCQLHDVYFHVNVCFA